MKRNEKITAELGTPSKTEGVKANTLESNLKVGEWLEKNKESISKDSNTIEKIDTIKSELDNKEYNKDTHPANRLKDPQSKVTFKLPEKKKKESTSASVKHFLNKYKRKLFLTLGLTTLLAPMSASGENKSISEKAFSDSVQTSDVKKIFRDSTQNNIDNVLKPGEKFRLLPEKIDVAGLTVEGRLLVATKETTKEVYLIKFSGEGEDLIGKELEALKALGLKPAPQKFLDEINTEAFNAAGKNLKVIDILDREAENLGQSRNMLVKENTVISIRNPVRTQTTEVGVMKDLGTTFDYATIAYRDKAENKTVGYSDTVTK